MSSIFPSFLSRWHDDVSTMFASVAVFVALSAVTTRLIQAFVPPTEVYFITCISVFCLLFGAAVGDPEAFFGLLFSVAPFAEKWLPSVVKSIDCLRDGEKRVQSMNKASDKNDDLVSYQKLFNEVRKRIQWRFIIASAICGIGVKYIAYEKPKVIGQMLDSVVKEYASMQTSFWSHFRPLVIFIILDYILLSMKEYYKYGAVHRFHKDAKTDMINNILNQDEDFIHEERHSAGFTHLMNVECNRMQRIVNETLTHLVFGLLTTIWGAWSLAHVDRRLTILGLFFKSPLVAMLQNLSRKDIVKYGKLYDASQGAAHRVARSILSPGVIHLLQANVAQRKAVGWYLDKQQDFIQYLEYTHLRQTLLCLVRHGLNNLEDVLLLAMGMTCVLEKTITIGMYFTYRSHLTLLDQGLKELFGLWDEIMTIRMTSKGKSNFHSSYHCRMRDDISHFK
jgi:ABC-type multidrug transport system fused ATPase/permease subunit